MKIDVATDAVGALADGLRRAAGDLDAMSRGVFELWAPDLASGSRSLDQAVYGLRTSWGPQITNLHGDLYRLQAALTAMTTAYDAVETGAASSFTAGAASGS